MYACRTAWCVSSQNMTLDSFLSQIQLYPSGPLREQDRQQIHRINTALPITADVSRADILLYGRISNQRLQVLHHVMPNSISSHHAEEVSGRYVPASEQPLVLNAFVHGRGGRRQLEIVSSGAPVIQDVFPVYSPDGWVIAAFVIESNMIAHERQRRRDPNFRRAVLWLQTMCMRGDVAGVEELSNFGLYDGIYVVDRNRMVTYMSGITANLFRSIGLAVDMDGQQVSELEPQDDALVDEVWRTNVCTEQRHETADGRVWVRKALPLRRSPTWRMSMATYSALEPLSCHRAQQCRCGDGLDPQRYGRSGKAARTQCQVGHHSRSASSRQEQSADNRRHLTHPSAARAGRRGTPAAFRCRQPHSKCRRDP